MSSIESNTWSSHVSGVTATQARENLMILYGILASIQRRLLPIQKFASSLGTPFALLQ